MNKPSQVTLNIEQNRAVIRVMGPFEHGLVHQARDAFKAARDVYYCKRLEMEIDSPGGSVQVCEALLHEMQMWRAGRGTISTQALMQAASAGAYTLSMGDVGQRRVLPYTELVFHNSRVNVTSAAITSESAAVVASQMAALDKAFVERLSAHIGGSFESVRDFAALGLARCQSLEQHLVSVLPRLKSVGIAGKAAALGASVIKIKGAYQACLNDDTLKPYQKMLQGLWAADRPVSAPIAWAMLLIDEIESIHELSASLRPTDVSSVPTAMDPERRLKMAA